MGYIIYEEFRNGVSSSYAGQTGCDGTRKVLVDMHILGYLNTSNIYMDSFLHNL